MQIISRPAASARSVPFQRYLCNVLWLWGEPELCDDGDEYDGLEDDELEDDGLEDDGLEDDELEYDGLEDADEDVEVDDGERPVVAERVTPAPL